MLNFSLSQDKSSLLLEDKSFYPLDTPRYEDLFLGKPLPSPPQFTAWQVQANISAYDLDLLYPPGYDSYGRPLGTSMGGFALAYEYVIFPAQDPNDILIIFSLIGINDGYWHPRVDMEFSAENRTEETVQIVLSRDQVTDVLNISALELVSRVNSTGPNYVFGDEFSRRLDLLASKPNATTFIPRDWNVCGRKDDFRRQRLCDIADWWSDYWLLFIIIAGSVLGAIPVFAGLFYLVGSLRKGQTMSAEYVEKLQKSGDESERLIDRSDLQNDARGYTQDQPGNLPEAGMVVVVDGGSKLEQADLLEPAKESARSKPLPIESDPTPEGQMTSHDDSRIEEAAYQEDQQFGPFVHNVGKSV